MIGKIKNFVIMKKKDLSLSAESKLQKNNGYVFLLSLQTIANATISIKIHYFQLKANPLKLVINH